MVDSCQKSLNQNFDFTKPCLSCSPYSISPFRVCIKARLVDGYVFKRAMVDLGLKSFNQMEMEMDTLTWLSSQQSQQWKNNWGLPKSLSITS